MGKFAEIFNYFKECPQLHKLWSIAATEDVGVRVIFPQGGSPAVQYKEFFDNLGNYNCEIIPYPSVYEDYQINCYQAYDAKDNNSPELNVNVLNIDEVQAICDWVKKQNETENFPAISGETVVSIECNPSIPQIRYVNPEDNTIAYFITVRIRFVNKERGREIIRELKD